MRKSNKRNVLKAIALGFAVASVFTGAASGGPSPEIPYLSHGQGVTDTPFQSAPGDGPTFMNGTPDGYVGSGIESVSGGVTPTDLARAVAPGRPMTVAAASDGSDRDHLVLGFGLGLILATACAAALIASRARPRMAHA